MRTNAQNPRKKWAALLLSFALMFTGCFGSMGPILVSAEAGLTIVKPEVLVTGQGIVPEGIYSGTNVANEKSYTRAELKAMADGDPSKQALNRYLFSALNTYDTKKLYLSEGLRVETLLGKSGIDTQKMAKNKIEFMAGDGYKITFDPSRKTPGDKANARTTQHLGMERYYYPNFLTGINQEASELGKTIMPTILAWASDNSTSALPSAVTDHGNDGLIVQAGQLTTTDYNNPLYNKTIKKIQVGEGIVGTALTIGSKPYTRGELLQLDRADKAYTYTTSGGEKTDYVRGVPLSVLLADYKDDDVVTFGTADGFEVSASAYSKKELVANDYILAYETGTSATNLAGVFDTAKKDPTKTGVLTLYGSDANGKPAKLVNAITISSASTDFANSPYKHITNGGITGQTGPYNIDAITGATLTVSGPGVKSSVPLSVRTIENQNGGAHRDNYSDTKNGEKKYEGITLSHILKKMPDGNKVELTADFSKVKIQNRARQTIAEFTKEQIEEADASGKPILVAYGVGLADGSKTAPFVYDAQSGIIDDLKNDDGCLKLVYDKSKITGDTNSAYTDFGNMAYIYVEGAEAPGYKHQGATYGNASLSEYIVSLRGEALGREINLSVSDLEKLGTEDSTGANTIGQYDSANMAFKKSYSLTNTAYWLVNEYQGIKLKSLLDYFKVDQNLADETEINFNAWDGYASAEKFSWGDLKDPTRFGFYEKNAADLGDSAYSPVPEDKKDAGYPVMLAYGINSFPYVKAKTDPGFNSGLENDGGPMRVIYGKRNYFTNNGSNQIQKVQDVIVGKDTYKYSTHKYHSNETYKEMAADEANAVSIVVNDQEGSQIKTKKYTLGELEDIIYGAGVSKQDAAAAKSKGKLQLEKNGSRYTDLYEGINLEYLITKVLEVPGNKGTVTFSDGTNKVVVSIEELMAKGTNPDTKSENLSATLAFAKNGAPMVEANSSPGYEKEFAIGTEGEKFTVKNDGGPVTLLIPSTQGIEGTSDAKSLKSIKTIEIDLSTDKYAHLQDPYSNLATEKITFSGAGTYITNSKELSVADIEGKQTLALTGDYNIKKDGGAEEQIRYRGVSLYDLLRSKDIGVRSNADKVIVTDTEGGTHEFSLAQVMKKNYINGQNGDINNLQMILAFGSSDVTKEDREDGKPLVKNKADAGYDEKYKNAGGPIRLVVGQTDAADVNSPKGVKFVKSIEVTAKESASQKHNISEIYKQYENTEFTVRVQNADNSSAQEKKYTVAELEAMDSIIARDDFSWVGLNEHEGVKLWDLVKASGLGVTDDTNISSVSVYSGTFSKDVLSIWGKEQVVNGIKDSADNKIRKPILLAYSQNGYPLVPGANSEGYMDGAANGDGPVRLITHENQGACVKKAEKVVITLGTDGPIEPPVGAKDITLKVDGEELGFSAYELKAMTAVTENYKVKSENPNITARGVLLYDLLKSKNVTNPQAQITLKTPDNFQNTGKGSSYKNITLKQIKEQRYMVAYAGAAKVDAPEAEIIDFDDEVKNSPIKTKVRVYRNYTSNSAEWYNECKNITEVEAEDYELAIEVDGKAKTFTMAQLKAMEAKTGTYQKKGASKIAKGVMLYDLLNYHGYAKPQTKLTLKTYDEYAHATYKEIAIEDIKTQNYMVAYEEGGSPVADIVKNDTVKTNVRIYRNLTEDTVAWANEVTNVVAIELKLPKHDFEVLSGDGSSLPMSSMRDMASDFEGGYWIGTYGGGLAHRKADGTTSVLNLSSTPALEGGQVSAVAGDRSGGVWFGDNASYTASFGLKYMDAAGNIITYTKKNTSGGLPNDYIQALYIDDKGDEDITNDVIYAGTFGGLAKFEKSTSTWTSYTKANKGLPAESVSVITPDGSGGLWLGFYPDGGETQGPWTGGYARMAKDGTFTNYSVGTKEREEEGTYRATNLFDVWVRSIAVDRDGGAWVVRSGAYSYLANVGGRIDYIKPDGTVIKYTGKQLLGKELTVSGASKNNEVRTVTVDPTDNNLIFGTSGDGLIKVVPPRQSGGKTVPGGVTVKYNSTNGAWNDNLSYDNIYNGKIIEGKLFAASAGGIATIEIGAIPKATEIKLSIHKEGKFVMGLTQEMLTAVQAIEGNKKYNYSGYNTYPTWKTREEAQGPSVAGVLARAGVDVDLVGESNVISFEGKDGFKTRITKEQLFADRYYFPNGSIATESGAQGGSSAKEGMVKVPAILDMNNGNGTVSLGQERPNEQTWDSFAKFVGDGGKIVILDEAAQAKKVEESSIISGATVTKGEQLDFTKPDGDAKVYYTLDGTSPTADSTMYNYRAARWGEGVNAPGLNSIGKMEIKTIVMDRGKKSSEISTFSYTVIPKAATNVKAEKVKDREIKVSWSHEDGGNTKFLLYKATEENGPWKPVAATAKGVTEFTESNLDWDTNYFYKVVAVGEDKEGTAYNGEESQTASAKTGVQGQQPEKDPSTEPEKQPEKEVGKPSKTGNQPAKKSSGGQEGKIEAESKVISEDGKVAITGAAGAIPEGATVIITDVTNTATKPDIGKEKMWIGVFDIKLMSKDGFKVQPNGKVKVTITVSKEQLTQYEYFYIVSFDGDNKEWISCTVNRETGEVTFETDHFSNYGLAGSNEKEGATEKDGSGFGGLSIQWILGILVMMAFALGIGIKIGRKNN